MALTVFFSWQMDRPDGGERALIERALTDALKRIAADATVEAAVREIEVDRDTKGVPGTPPIVDTILAKIDRAAIFVLDLTFVAIRADGRPAPNPNVLIEYGWALKSMGHSRMMPVMNIAYGEPTADAMPFDMRHLRNPIKFSQRPGANAEVKRTERDKLSRELEAAIRTTIQSGVLTEVVPKPSAFPAAEPKDGQARFRPKGKSLGMTYPNFIDESTDVFLAQGTAAWLRIMPVKDQGRVCTTAELRAAATQGQILAPLYGSPGGLDWIRADDGVGRIRVRTKGSVTTSVVFMFHTGEVWSIDTTRFGTDAVPVSPVALIAALKRYAEFLKDKLGVMPPYRCVVGVEGVRGRPIWLPDIPGTGWMTNQFGSCVADAIQREVIYEEAADVAKLLRPFFEDAYEKCGFEDVAMPREAPGWR